MFIGDFFSIVFPSTNNLFIHPKYATNELLQKISEAIEWTNFVEYKRI